MTKMTTLIRLGQVSKITKANRLTVSADGTGMGACPGGAPQFVKSRFGNSPC